MRKDGRPTTAEEVLPKFPPKERKPPTKYTQALADRICVAVADGQSMRTVCSAEGMPDMVTVFKWLRVHDDFNKQYTRAKEEQAEALIEDMIDIADETEHDWKTVKRGDTEYEVPDQEVINRSRLRVDTRKWIASKLKPKKYGEKLEIEGVKMPDAIIVNALSGSKICTLGVEEKEYTEKQ